jgi:hypothetical protein
MAIAAPFSSAQALLPLGAAAYFSFLLVAEQVALVAHCKHSLDAAQLIPVVL